MTGAPSLTTLLKYIIVIRRVIVYCLYSGPKNMMHNAEQTKSRKHLKTQIDTHLKLPLKHFVIGYCIRIVY